MTIGVGGLTKLGVPFFFTPLQFANALIRPGSVKTGGLDDEGLMFQLNLIYRELVGREEEREERGEEGREEREEGRGRERRRRRREGERRRNACK